MCSLSSMQHAVLVCRSGIELVLNSKVQSVSKNRVSVSGPGGKVVDIPFGACVWATGVAMHPLVKQLQVHFCCWCGSGQPYCCSKLLCGPCCSINCSDLLA